MAVTHKELIQKSTIALELGKARDSRVLSDMASNLKKWGSLTARQIDYAQSLMDRYDSVKIEEVRNRREKIKKDWDNKSEDLLNWLDFVAFFFGSNNCKRYQFHVETLRSRARHVR